MELQEFQEYMENRHLKKLMDEDPDLAADFMKTSQLMVQPHLPDLPLLADPYLKVDKSQPNPSRRFRNSTHLLRTMEAAVKRKKQDQDLEKKQQEDFLK